MAYYKAKRKIETEPLRAVTGKSATSGGPVFDPIITNETITKPKRSKFESEIAPDVAAGLGAADIGKATDKKTAIAKVAVATLIGGLTGGPVGGISALLASSLDAWLQVGAENKRRRSKDKLIKEIEAKNARREAQQRADDRALLKYDREKAEQATAWEAAKEKIGFITQFVNSNQNLKDRYIKTGVSYA